MLWSELDFFFWEAVYTKANGTICENENLQFPFICSFGTFSFWSAYLRPSGDVIVADGYYQKPPLLLTYIKKALPQWKLLRDPCYENSSKHQNGNGTKNSFLPIRLSKQCEGDKKIEYGVYDSWFFSIATKNRQNSRTETELRILSLQFD